LVQNITGNSQNLLLFQRVIVTKLDNVTITGINKHIFQVENAFMSQITGLNIDKCRSGFVVTTNSTLSIFNSNFTNLGLADTINGAGISLTNSNLTLEN
jgi:hypothetical protein